jgi:TatD DNase family protein
MADYKLSAMHDIHTHLYWQSYDTDRDEVVRRAREAGVDKMLVIGCTVEESRQAITVAEQYPQVYASVGIHPSFFNELVEKSPTTKIQDTNNHQSPISNLKGLTSELREMAKHEKVVAIGECGLEYYAHNSEQPITEAQKAAQKAGFLAQIDLAEELELPMILHCRASTGSADAYEDLFEILSNQYSIFDIQHSSCILHCYMGDTEVTERFLSLPNVYFSFTGNITYPIKKVVSGTKPARIATRSVAGGDDLTETVKLIPLDRIFTETDCPFLTPQSHRGERNEPAYVAEVLECIARLHGVEPKVVEQLTESNFKKVFPMVQ